MVPPKLSLQREEGLPEIIPFGVKLVLTGARLGQNRIFGGLQFDGIFFEIDCVLEVKSIENVRPKIKWVYSGNCALTGHSILFILHSKFCLLFVIQ